MSWNQPNGIPPLVGQAKGKFGKRFRKYEYVLDPDVTFCNNGAFSAVPKRVLEVQARFRYIQETDPEAWFRYEVKREIANATDKVAEMFGSNPESLILVENASTAANTVLKSLTWIPGDRILITTEAFLSVKNTAFFVASINPGVEIITMDIKFPIASKDQLIDQLKEKIDCNSGIKLIILDHITGPSAILMPIEELIQVCHQKGVMVMVDGAHAPGQVKLELDKLGADFYIGNLHKWCYSARGCAFLYVNSKVRDAVHPVVTTSFQRPRLRDRFILQGTKDYTSLCASSAAVEYFKDIGGLTAVTKYNSSLLSWATDMLCKAWNTSLLPIPDSMQAPFMVLIKMPDIENVPLTPEGSTSIAASVYKQHNLHIACTRVDGRFWLRLSAHIYNYEDDFYKLRDALMDMYQSSYNLNS